MISINNVLGIEKLMDNAKKINDLKQYIIDNNRYVVPGYEKDYFLYTFDHEVEFYLSRYSDGTYDGITVHTCSLNTLDLVYEKFISIVGTTHIYHMYSVASPSLFPVRIVCPDVLASPQKGDIVHGQLVAFAENISIYDTNDFFIEEINDNCVNIVGKICTVSEYSFEFSDVSTQYWDLFVDTCIGKINVIIQKCNLNFIPEENQIISFDAVLSFDVAVVPDSFNKLPFTETYFEESGVKSKTKPGIGFIPNRSNAERVIIDCIKTGHFNRMMRICNNEVEVIFNSKNIKMKNTELSECFSDYINQDVYECEINHIVSSDDTYYIGQNVISVKKYNEVYVLIYLSINNSGYIDKVHILSPSSCLIGLDTELHALSELCNGMCLNKPNILREIIAEKCTYRSEDADCMSFGAKRIIERMNLVANKLDETNQYRFEILPTREILCDFDNIPPVCRGNWCARLYQGSELAAYVFVQVEENEQISNILLSRSYNYIKEFKEAHALHSVNNSEKVNVRELLENYYGNSDTLNTMRESENSYDESCIYLWREADKYMIDWMRENGYAVTDIEIEDDCIGYACIRRGKEFAIFVYAYDKEDAIQIDADYCQHLKTYPLSKGRNIMVLCLNVEAFIDESGEKSYRAGRYNLIEYSAIPWMLEKLNDNNIFLFYPGTEVVDMVLRFIAMYNTQNLDLMKALLSDDVELEKTDGCCCMNYSVYSSLTSHYSEYGKMKTAYLIQKDGVYSIVAYLDDYCYFTFLVSDKTGKIILIKEHNLMNVNGSLLITDDRIESHPLNYYPQLQTVNFLPASELSRFSVRMKFDNGEIRRYDFPVTGINNEDEKASNLKSNDEIAEIDHISFTDKIFNNGKIVEHIDLPDGMVYSRYPQRGQGISFVNGYSISTAELYFGSYPIGKFSYAQMADKAHPLQYDYDEDGYAVGRIYDLNPANPLYLLNKNTLIAKELPEKYQNTEICIYPSCGGYSEGRVMVSLMDEIDLQYHHDSMACAGVWGWLDTELNEVIQPQYIYAMNFFDGCAIVCKGEWDIKETDGRKEYWCDNEQWGIIDINGNEIVPCEFDELYVIEGTDRLFFVHKDGWENGYYAIYDMISRKIILNLDFDFDMSYMFNECFVADGNILVFINHLPGKETDLIYAYDLHSEKYIVYKQEYHERTINGKKKVVVNRDGEEIIVF